MAGAEPKSLALIGANGMLARQVFGQAAAAGYAVSGFDLPDFDLTSRAQVLAEIERLRPAVIVNCAAYTNVDGCESNEELATRVNGDGPGYLAEAAQAVGAVLVHVSTDYVFAGDQKTPYLESEPTGPLSAYGRSKLAGERAILSSGLERRLIVRTSWLYGPGGKNFVETILRLAAEREELRIVADQVGSPTHTGDLAAAIFHLLAASAGAQESAPGHWGLYHFANTGQCSWYEFTCEIVRLARQSGLPLKVQRIVPITTADYPLPATRPAYSVFSTDKYRKVTKAEIPVWQESLQKYLEQRGA